MPSQEIKRINIDAFRGIANLELELDGNSLLLQGENGTGKSSIVEAIEFFFTGKISSLEGVKGLSLRRHGPHVKYKRKNASVTATFDPGDVSLKRTLSISPSPPKHLVDYFETASKGTFILRRSQILSFIMSRPADRFKTIGSIIGVEPLDEIELEMMRLRDDLAGRVSFMEEMIATLLIDTSSILGADIKDVEDVVPALNVTLKGAKLPKMTSLEDINKHARKMLRSIKKTAKLDKAARAKEVLGLIDVPSFSSSFIEVLSYISEEVKAFLEDDVRTELSLADILTRGSEVIKEEEMDVCPLCEQKIERKALLKKIEKRLKVMRDLSERASEVRKASVPIIGKIEEVAGRLTFLIESMKALDELSEERKTLQSISSSLYTLTERVVLARDLMNEMPFQDILQAQEGIDITIDAISRKLRNVLSEIRLSAKEEGVLEHVGLISQSASKIKDLERAKSEENLLRRHLDMAERIFNSFTKAKKMRVQDVYNSIQEDIQKFYSTLHPDELHGNIELAVAMGKRASTDLKMESFGREGEDPRALSSEGHLDTLGLCIFLAFVKKFNADLPLVVLDDVVTTVDARHRENICHLLTDEFRENQLIITTHDSVWFDQLRAHQRAEGLESNFKYLRIVDWDLDAGPRIHSHKPRWDIIQEMVKEGDKLGAGNRGRQYLEWTLEQICEALEVSVVYNTSKPPDVGDMLPPAEKRVKDLMKDSSFKKDILNAFKELRTTIMCGNILSHNNPKAEKLSIEEARRFCESVQNLHHSFLCPSCESFVDYYRKLKIVRCSNSKCEKPIEVKTR